MYRYTFQIHAGKINWILTTNKIQELYWTRELNFLSSEVYHHLPYQRSATYISSEKGAAGLSPRHSRATQLLEVEIVLNSNTRTRMILLNNRKIKLQNLLDFFCRVHEKPIGEWQFFFSIYIIDVIALTFLEIRKWWRKSGIKIKGKKHVMPTTLWSILLILIAK